MFTKTLHWRQVMVRTVLKRKITKGSITVPRAVMNALHLAAGDELGYVIEGDKVRLVNVAAEGHADPLVPRFLEFIASDAKARPHVLATFPPAMVSHMQALTADVRIDHDASTAGETAL